MLSTRRILVLLLCFCLANVALYAATEKMMSVQVKKSQIRSLPSFLGKIIADIAYGDRVTVLEEQGDWMKINANNSTSGWVHTSALTKKKIVMKAGAENVDQSASSDELALAGKGFNKEVEAEFKSQNPDVDFSWIDKMEKMTISQSEMVTFLKNGDLSMEGGA